MTKRQRLLMEMENVVPWSHLIDAIELNPEGRLGRPPIRLQRMLQRVAESHSTVSVPIMSISPCATGNRPWPR